MLLPRYTYVTIRRYVFAVTRHAMMLLRDMPFTMPCAMMLMLLLLRRLCLICHADIAAASRYATMITPLLFFFAIAYDTYLLYAIAYAFAIRLRDI